MNIAQLFKEFEKFVNFVISCLLIKILLFGIGSNLNLSTDSLRVGKCLCTRLYTIKRMSLCLISTYINHDSQSIYQAFSVPYRLQRTAIFITFYITYSTVP